MTDIIEKTKVFFHEIIQQYGSDPYALKQHLPLVEQWTNICLKENPEADKTICLLGCRLHDVGHYPLPAEIDHAIKGETMTQKFLEENNIQQNIIDQIKHCVRAHRCKDIQPTTIEAKIIAFSDSASHMTDDMYIGMIKKGLGGVVLEKLERDYRDIGIFPSMKERLTPLYLGRKSLLTEYIKIQNMI